MTEHPWVEEFPGAVTVCDREGIILEMNERAAKSFGKQGGKDLIGTNVLDCHPEAAREKLRGLMERQEAHVYTSKRKVAAGGLFIKAPGFRKGSMPASSNSF